MPPKPKQKQQAIATKKPIATPEDTQTSKHPENMSWKEEYFNPPNGNRFSVLR
jgi:hypothetical protein